MKLSNVFRNRNIKLIQDIHWNPKEQGISSVEFPIDEYEEIWAEWSQINQKKEIGIKIIWNIWYIWHIWHLQMAIFETFDEIPQRPNDSWNRILICAGTNENLLWNMTRSNIDNRHLENFLLEITQTTEGDSIFLPSIPKPHADIHTKNFHQNYAPKTQGKKMSIKKNRAQNKIFR